MYPIYRDLREKLGTPVWHDGHGVPRYAPFHPSLLGIYDEWACLFMVRCQTCGRLFPCASGFSVAHAAIRNKFKFSDRENPEKALEYLAGWGDAPWHGPDGEQGADSGQCSGTTMTTDVAVILELWHRAHCEWERVEVPLNVANRVCDLEGA